MREYRKNEREVTSEQKIELAKLQLAKLEKEIELQLAKNKALSLNPAAKVEEKQFETNIENMIKNSCLFRFFLYVSDSPLVSMEIPLRTAYSQAGRCGMQPKAKHSLRAQAHQSKSRTETVKAETLEKKLRIRERERRTREVREQALPSEYHRQTYL
ncbi:hypothetical protein TNCV_2649031 [Trichonephila clavipes]|uniref:Uncharacterized protein n=1 Tax=Trichonephila clavipes TaxID=2585209 RepID=A0A8X6RER8_TRICX|nr:hypothetical protein TNCV_2649031 [Trichonephila clavipes]